MRRREFITIIGGAAVAWPVVARGQQGERVRRICVLAPYTEGDPLMQVRIAALEQALQKLGWMKGANLRIDYRWPGDDPELMRTYAAELVSLKPDVILAIAGLALPAVQRETKTVPIVFLSIFDPVGSHFIDSLARPGGNSTGLALGEFSLGGKMLEVLKEVAPKVSNVVVLRHPGQPPQIELWRAIEAVSPSFGVRAKAVDVQDSAGLERAIQAVSDEQNVGMVVLPNAVTIVNRELLITLAARHRIPAVYGYRYFVTAGGLVSYGVDDVDLFGRAAMYVDRILNGAKPADLPVQQPTRYELAVNLKTARTLGLDVPLFSSSAPTR